MTARARPEDGGKTMPRREVWKSFRQLVIQIYARSLIVANSSLWHSSKLNLKCAWGWWLDAASPDVGAREEMPSGGVEWNMVRN